MSEPPGSRRSARTAVCTIVSNNYLPFARTLMGSLREIHPEWDQHVLITDEIRGHFNPQSEDFEVLEVEELPLPGGRRMLFQYSILELNTAVKPWWLAWLFDRGDYDRVIYLDPDILLYQRLEEVERSLDAGSLMCLTPHLTRKLSEDLKPNEIDILRAGAYNLGFIALSRHPDLADFLAWWQSKMESDCVVDFDSGIPIQGALRENVMTVVEKWASLDALKAHIAAPHMATYSAQVKDLTVGLSLQLMKSV